MSFLGILYTGPTKRDLVPLTELLRKCTGQDARTTGNISQQKHSMMTKVCIWSIPYFPAEAFHWNVHHHLASAFGVLEKNFKNQIARKKAQICSVSEFCSMTSWFLTPIRCCLQAISVMPLNVKMKTDSQMPLWGIFTAGTADSDHKQ